MEGNSNEIKQLDCLIIGGGFKGMMAAYGLAKQGKCVSIVDIADKLGGFMVPMNWNGCDLDKGPQYLDGVDKVQKAVLDDIMQGFEPLSELEFSYASYWNEKTTEGFAIPDYRSLGSDKCGALLLETVNAQTDCEADNLADYIGTKNQVSSKYLNTWCRKFLNASMEEISPLNQSFVTFFGRKLLLDNDVSLELKQLPYLDDRLAAAKKSVDHGTYNLYPKGKNLGYFREAFVNKLTQLSVHSKLATRVCKIEPVEGGYNVTLERNGERENTFTKDVIFSGTIESTEQLLFGTERMKDFVRPVSQVFYLIELDEEVELPFYTMNYSESSIARVTSFSAYSEASPSGKPIICVEVPAPINSEIWQSPDMHFEKLQTELAGMGVFGICQFKAIKVPSTYRVLLHGYESQLAQLTQEAEHQYGQGVHILTPHLLTRASIMTDLANRGVLAVD